MNSFLIINTNNRPTAIFDDNDDGYKKATTKMREVLIKENSFYTKYHIKKCIKENKDIFKTELYRMKNNESERLLDINDLFFRYNEILVPYEQEDLLSLCPSCNEQFYASTVKNKKIHKLFESNKYLYCVHCPVCGRKADIENRIIKDCLIVLFVTEPRSLFTSDKMKQVSL